MKTKLLLFTATLFSCGMSFGQPLGEQLYSLPEIGTVPMMAPAPNLLFPLQVPVAVAQLPFLTRAEAAVFAAGAVAVVCGGGLMYRAKHRAVVGYDSIDGLLLGLGLVSSLLAFVCDQTMES